MERQVNSGQGAGTAVRRVLPVIAAAAAIAAASPAAETRWTRVDAPHFVVSGNAPPEEIRHAAFLLEMFREVFLRVLPSARDRSLVPPFVVAFGSDKAFTPFKPVYDGKPAPVGGYVVQEPLAPCVALRIDRSQESIRTIFHEYAHVLFDAPHAPLWLREGVSDYYSTVRLKEDRRHVVLGTLVPSHVSRVWRTWVPLNQIVSASRASNSWDGEAGQAFYAESWVLVHYLIRGTSARGAQIVEFLERLRRGEDESSAFEHAIGPLARIDAELRRYVRSGMAPPVERELPAQVGLKAVRERTMSAAEVEATLGRLLFQLGRDDEALSRLNAAIGLDPELAEAHATIGLLHLRQGRPAEAIGPFRHAAARDPSNVLVAYDYALVSLQAEDGGTPAPLDDAYAALHRVIRRDGPAEPIAVLGTIAGRLGRLDEAEPLLRRAAELVPSRFPTQIELANVCLRIGKFDEAHQILSRLSAGAEADQAEVVGQRLRWLAMAEERATLRGELTAAAGLQAAGRDVGIERTGVFPKPPDLRTPREGEQRVAGLLDAVECKSGGIAVRVTTRWGTISLPAASLSDVHLSSARSDVGGVLACGVRERREAVYVTRSADHRLAAIEFLPADYQPGR
jgi:tetratricopeptide (TPR) repeat protein